MATIKKDLIVKSSTEKAVIQKEKIDLASYVMI
ncbi:MAG: hypothetical protein BWZ03_00559 [bacterium ADurb.BinA186]|nr:MAG: hypothetical protein BWZ03_00559 [bacterium ADurb.BinA186]